MARPPQPQPGDQGGVRDKGQALYRLVMEPLLPHLEGRRRLYLSTEGQLHLVPFAALHDGRDHLLGRYRFSYVTGGQSLLRGAGAGAPPRGDVVVFADPDFSALPAGLMPLKGTRREAEDLRRLFPSARLYLGKEASKENLLVLRAPAILHVATHGIFLGEDSASGDAEGRSLKIVKDSAAAAAPPVKTLSLRQPAALSSLVRSMLLLAAGKGRDKDEGEEGRARGMLTALEVAGMDLSGTQLIVLSACETGKGELRIGQGVYGLRRAFFLAGAETVVTSLWRVSDDATQELMQSYYRHLLKGAGRAEAMELAAAEMRRRRPHPYFWAPFIVIGDDRPLSLR
jgi:CHAT domain-containing protein